MNCEIKLLTMKTLLIVIICLLFTARLFAPADRAEFIERPIPINHYDRLIYAVTTIESMRGKYTYNEKEGAVGWFQIRQVRVDHYNRLTGSDYHLNDFYDYKLSSEMFLFFARGKSFEQAARNWNGSGPKTIEYWQKVKAHL